MAKKRVAKKPLAQQGGLIPGPDELNIPPSDFLEYTTCLYGTKGIGKTTLASSFPGYLTVMTEPRRRNLKIRMVELRVNDVVALEQGEADGWLVFKEIIDLARDDDTVRGISVDTVDRMYDACLAHHCKEAGVEHPGGLNDFGALWSIIKEDFERTLNSIRDAGMGLLLISHAKESDIELNTGQVAKSYAPSTPGAATRYVKAACDYALFYGYHGRKRCIHLRGFEKIWTACGVKDHFISKSGEPLSLIEIPADKVENGYEILQAGFNNELYDLDEEPDDEEAKPKTRRKRNV